MKKHKKVESTKAEFVKDGQAVENAEAVATETAQAATAEASVEKTGQAESDLADEQANATAADQATNKVADAESADETTDATAALNQKITDLEEQVKQLKDQNLRQSAEFDNFRRRTRQEKANLYDDVTCEVVKEWLPVVDNLERALNSSLKIENEEAKSVVEGLQLIKQQVDQCLNKLGVTEIAAKGEPFDPERHNAVLHVEDAELSENVVKEVLEKGYSKDDKVIRHSSVMVAN